VGNNPHTSESSLAAIVKGITQYSLPLTEKMTDEVDEELKSRSPLMRNILGRISDEDNRKYIFSIDPLILLAERAATDPEVKSLMRVVANGEATQDQLKNHQSHIDQLTNFKVTDQEELVSGFRQEMEHMLKTFQKKRDAPSSDLITQPRKLSDGEETFENTGKELVPYESELTEREMYRQIA
jgi:hypothetical protein